MLITADKLKIYVPDFHVDGFTAEARKSRGRVGIEIDRRSADRVRYSAFKA
jgi:hypothetical protein